jgi:hypothetical protein
MTQWGISQSGIAGGGVPALGVTGPSALEGDVDQAMLNLALDATAPVSARGVCVRMCIHSFVKSFLCVHARVYTWTERIFVYKAS